MSIRPAIFRKIGGTLLLLGGVATLLEDLQQLIANAIPILPYVCIVVGLLLLFVPQKQWSRFVKCFRHRTNIYGELVYEVPFDRPLRPPEWVAIGGFVEEFTTVDASDVGIARGLRIAMENDGRCEHYLPSRYRNVRFVEFVGKDFSKLSGFRLCGIATRGDDDIRFNLLIELTEGTPKQLDDTWWKVMARPISLGGGWKSVLVDLNNVWPHTFGTSDWDLQCLESVSLDGSMTMARITLRK